MNFLLSFSCPFLGIKGIATCYQILHSQHKDFKTGMTLFVFAEAPLNDFNVNIFRRGYLVTTYSCKAKDTQEALELLTKRRSFPPPLPFNRVSFFSALLELNR